MRHALYLLGLSVLVACGSSSNSNFGDGTSSSSGGNGTSSGGFGNPNGDGGTGANQAGCSDAAKLVYVLSEESGLYSFLPSKSQFTKIGTLKCPSGATPNSMAVDRTGTAWVNYSDGGLFKVSTTDASCTATTFQKGQHGFTRFGMAFSTNGQSSTDETLYVSGISDVIGGLGLAKIDLTTMKLTPIGDYSGNLANQSAELTGTGDGRLYGFFTTQPDTTLAKIDSASGATSGDTDLHGVYIDPLNAAWAFSFWGGDFWFYTSNGQPSTVTRLKTSSDNSLSTSMADVGGFRIVGAGVSTCAPTTPPPVN